MPLRYNYDVTLSMPGPYSDVRFSLLSLAWYFILYPLYKRRTW